MSLSGFDICWLCVILYIPNIYSIIKKTQLERHSEFKGGQMFTNACAINIPSPLKSSRVCLNNYSESMDKQCILTPSYSNVLPSIDIYWCSNQHAGNNYRTYWHTCWVEIAHTCWFITFCWWLWLVFSYECIYIGLSLSGRSPSVCFCLTGHTISSTVYQTNMRSLSCVALVKGFLFHWC